jgi:uncharacterized protein (DUF1015 family)
MHILPFRALFPNLNLIPSPDYFFSTVKEEFPEYYDSGFFEHIGAEAFYVYQIQSARRDYLGFVGCVDLRDYREGAIKKHEQTIADQEQKQMQLALKRKAGVKPILLTYPDVPEIGAWLRRFAERHNPVFEVHFEADGQHHRLWAVHTPEDVAAARQLFLEQVPVTYIADGHHRIATTTLMHEKLDQQTEQGHYGTLLAAFFSSADLEILDFNRVVDALEDITPTQFLAGLSQLFDIEYLPKPEKPRRKHELVLYMYREWYRLTWRPHILQADDTGVAALDAALLNEKVLRDILGIGDVRNDLRVEYVEGPKGLEGLRKKALKNKNAVAFCLYPIQLEDLFALADAEQMLPPKSTWFEPRMKNGMLVQEF